MTRPTRFASIRQLLLAILLTVPAAVSAQTIQAPIRTETVSTFAPTLRVGITESPPFAMIASDGAWTGIGVDLWRMIAEAEGYDYEWVALEANAGEAVARGVVDLALPVTATADAEATIDFTIPYYTATLGAAGAGGIDVLGIARTFLSWTFLRVVLIVSAILLVVGALMWLIERRANPAQFGTEDEDTGRPRRWLRGIGSGFWWSGVTMTTIGYGDKAPVTTLGRGVAMIWMLVAMALTSSLTASIVGATNLSRLTQLQIPGDLRDMRLGALPDSAAAGYLESEGLAFTDYDSVEAAMRAVEEDRIDAVVANLPLLQHANGATGASLTVSPSRAEPGLVSFALPEGSELREPLNAAILRLTTGSGWTDLIERYAPAGRR